MGQAVVSVLRGFWPQDQTGAASPPSHSLNVGNSSDPDPDARVTQNDSGSAALIPEALANIRLLVNHELPDGSGNEHNITFHPYGTVSQLRATMETFSNIPQDNIYFLFKTDQLVDSLTLYSQQVGAYDRITMRDNRLVYPYPF
ncbi:hypothetical protein RRG08_064826 [Elysia crispata]|uniref:Ubiquitin-like domain-containing protein n=1 Tax=Elysia crispata TaxID=231223 RepID=A0AAE1EAW4_9GAST|nr:hypothetical protein RRG08_064826 [Elysia crispata]